MVITVEEHLQRIGELRAESSLQRAAKPVIPFNARTACEIGFTTLHEARGRMTTAQVEDLLNSLAALYPLAHAPGVRGALHVD